MDKSIKRRRDVKWSFFWIRPVVHADGHPRSSEVADCTPSLSLESLTLQLSAWVRVVGSWRRGFFFQAVFGVESGQSMSTWTVNFPCKFYLGVGVGGFIFLSANGKVQGALLLFFLSLGGEKDFFPFFPVSQCVLTMFPLLDSDTAAFCPPRMGRK
jgi:hypothetical protein